MDAQPTELTGPHLLSAYIMISAHVSLNALLTGIFRLYGVLGQSFLNHYEKLVRAQFSPSQSVLTLSQPVFILKVENLVRKL